MLVGERFSGFGQAAPAQEPDWKTTPHIPIVILGADAARVPNVKVQLFTSDRQLISEKVTDSAGRAVFTTPSMGVKYIVKPVPPATDDEFNPEEMLVQSLVVEKKADWDNPKFAAFFQKAKKGPPGLMSLLITGGAIIGGLWLLAQIATRYGGDGE